MSSNRSDSDTDCDINPLEDVEDASNHNIADEPKQPAAEIQPRVSGDRNTNLWDIFEKVPGERGIAKCRLCYRKLSFRSTSNNLKKHLEHIHKLDIDAGILYSSADEPKQPAAEIQPVSGDRNTNIWDIFEKVPGERGIAKCRLCYRKLSFRTTSANLRKHLEHIHALEIDAGILPSSKLKSSEISERANKKAEEKDLDLDSKLIKTDDEDTDTRNSINPYSRPYRSKSIAWKYFSIACRTRRRARCKLCSKIYSYATTVTNLLTHLERRHNNVHLEENGQLQATPTSPLWAYFKCLDETMQLASCLICKKRVDYSDDCRELKRHLARKHPNVDLEESSTGKTFMVTDSGDLFEIDVNKEESVPAQSDNDEDETYDTDYLDDTTYDEPEERIKLKTNRNTPKIRMLSHEILKQQSEDLELSKPKEVQELTKEIPEDSIDIFGRYIVSLLKKMPKNSSDKLQYQIVKQIFEVQSEEATTVKDNNVTSNSEQSPV